VTALPIAGEVHLRWLPVAPAQVHWDVLDEGERALAQRFPSPAAKDRLASSRAGQRRVLAEYLERPPGSAGIVRRCGRCGEDHGKPVCPQAAVVYSASRTDGAVRRLVLRRVK
jgi:hypothetical protein